MTIIEARSEIKMLHLMIAAHRAFITKHLFRPASDTDPFAEDEGGEEGVVERQLQAVTDMEEEIIALRRAVVAASNKAQLTMEGRTMSLADWEFWRREIAPKRLSHGGEMVDRFETIIIKKAALIFNVSEAYAVDLTNELGQILCLLDGQLAVKNATTFIEDLGPIAARPEPALPG
jgi:hypothetical protein